MFADKMHHTPVGDICDVSASDIPQHDIPVVSDTQAYKQFGNAVAVPLVTILARALVSALSKSHA